MTTDNPQSSPTGDTGGALPYDFTRAPETLPPWMESLHEIAGEIASAVSIALVPVLGCGVSFEPREPEVRPLAEFWSGVDPNACLALLRLEPDAGFAACLFDPPSAACFVEMLLGGTCADGIAPKPATDLERRLLAPVFAQVSAAVMSAWPDAHPLRVACQPATAVSDPPAGLPIDQNVVALRFALQGEGAFGELTLFLPEALFAEENEVPIDTPTTAVHPEARERMLETLRQARVRVDVSLDSSSMSVRDVLAIQVGDVLVLNHHASRPLTLSLNGLPKLKAMPANGTKRRVLTIVEGPRDLASHTEA